MSNCPFKKFRKKSEKIDFPPGTYDLLSEDGRANWLNAMGFTPENTMIASGSSDDGKIVYPVKKGNKVIYEIE